VCFCMRVDHYLNSKVHSLQAELRDLESATSLLAQEETVQATSQWYAVDLFNDSGVDEK